MYNIRSERVRRNMTVKDVADTIGVHRNAVYRWERGQTEPRGSHLVALARLYGCTPDYLLGLTEDRKGSAVAGRRELVT